MILTMCQSLRIASFLATQLPAPNYHCRYVSSSFTTVYILDIHGTRAMTPSFILKMDEDFFCQKNLNSSHFPSLPPSLRLHRSSEFTVVHPQGIKDILVVNLKRQTTHG